VPLALAGAELVEPVAARQRRDAGRLPELLEGDLGPASGARTASTTRRSNVRTTAQRRSSSRSGSGRSEARISAGVSPAASRSSNSLMAALI
jgi:hypothetical protein